MIKLTTPPYTHNTRTQSIRYATIILQSWILDVWKHLHVNILSLPLYFDARYRQTMSYLHKKIFKYLLNRTLFSYRQQNCISIKTDCIIQVGTQVHAVWFFPVYQIIGNLEQFYYILSAIWK